MPLIDIHVMEGVITPEEKRRMIGETARAFGKVAGKAMHDATSVRVHQVPSDSWGGADSVWTTEWALQLKDNDGAKAPWTPTGAVLTIP